MTIEPVMSPGIRSGVNCTRRVSTDSDAARVRTSRVFAVPGHPLHAARARRTAVRPAARRRRRPGRRPPWRPRGARRRDARAPRRGRARSAVGGAGGLGRLGGGVGHVRRTSLSSAARASARRDQVPVGAGWGSGGGQQRGHVLDGTVGVAGDVVRAVPARRRRGPGGAARQARSRAARRSALRGVGPVAGATVEPAAAQGRLDRLHDDRQRLACQGPSRRPRHSTRPTEARTSSEQRPGRASPAAAR